MFATWSTVPRAASMLAGAPTPTDTSSRTRTPALAAASVIVSATSFATALGAVARCVPPRLTDDLAGAAGDDCLDLGSADVDAAAQGHRHDSRRTTSSSGAAVRPRAPLVGGVGAGVPTIRSDAERQHDDRRLLLTERESGARGVAVGEPVRAGGDPFVPGGEQHVLRGAPRVEGHRPLAGDDDRDDEPRAEHVLGDEHASRRAPRPARGSPAARTATAGGSTPTRRAGLRRGCAPRPAPAGAPARTGARRGGLRSPGTCPPE